MKIKSRKIGLLGGTFDPVHQGHLALAAAAAKEIKLDQIYFVPAKRSPTKLHPKSSDRDRVSMLKCAIKKSDRFHVSLYDVRRSSPSYTINLIKFMKRKHPRSELFFILGSDLLAGFHRWKNWRGILKLSTLVIGKRKLKFNNTFKKHSIDLKGKFPSISSTNIRKELKRTGKCREVPEAVLKYIKKKALYC